ncbi:tetratricopeptide repeat protein [Campylobacter mucosalis]|uniref:tetratricopeptide repeat protein n=1 Tax=Campylobacter mucosalis TaxID=202 RepID=UPI001B8BC2B2|nr:sel1 repeat family protein [Campylobacter mucosalis]
MQKYNDKDPSSLDIFEKLAKTGDTNSQNMAGVIYYEGELVPENLDKAKEFFLKAIKYEHPLAAYNLANVYDYEGDDKNAKFYYKKACEWGYEESCEK